MSRLINSGNLRRPPNTAREFTIPEGSAVHYAVYESRSISWAARGVLVWIHTHPDEPVTIPRIIEAAGELKRFGRDGATSILNELIDAGLLTPKDGDGRLYQKTKIPEELRQRVLERDGYRCVGCESIKRLSVDHIVPERHGGPTTFENLQTLCRPCNSEKGAKI